MHNIKTQKTKDEEKRKLKRQSQRYNLETLKKQEEDKRKQRGNHKCTI
jgi:hypothetical protein